MKEEIASVMMALEGKSILNGGAGLHRQEWQDWYRRYLQTAEWKERAESVMRRAGRMCEGCRKNPAIHVHHTTYAHVGAELLWELRAVCAQCHHRAHPDKDQER